MRVVADSGYFHRSVPSDERLLAALRAEFPDWGIVYDTFGEVWVALRGKDQTLVAADAAALRARLTHADGYRPPR